MTLKVIYVLEIKCYYTTSKAIVRRERSASDVHKGRSSLVELENPATEHSDAFSAFLPPTTLPLDDDPIKTVFSVNLM